MRARAVIGGALLALGTFFLLDAVGVLDVSGAVVVPVILVTAGLVILFGGWPRPAGAGAGAWHTSTGEGGVGKRLERPEGVLEANSVWRLGMGDLTLDLGNAQLAEAQTTTVEANVGIGSLRVTVPAGVPVRAAAKAGMGDLRVFDENRNGMGVEQLVADPGWDEALQRLDLDLSVGMGSVKVQRP